MSCTGTRAGTVDRYGTGVQKCRGCWRDESGGELAFFMKSNADRPAARHYSEAIICLPGATVAPRDKRCKARAAMKRKAALSPTRSMADDWGSLQFPDAGVVFGSAGAQKSSWRAECIEDAQKLVNCMRSARAACPGKLIS